MTTTEWSDFVANFTDQVRTRLDVLAARAAAGELDEAVDLLTRSVQAGGVIQAFGTGHSEAFAMEIAGRAGGLIPTNKIALRDLVLHGGRDVGVLSGGSGGGPAGVPSGVPSGATLERDSSVAAALWELTPIQPPDVFIIASNSGVNGSIVGLALQAKEHGHAVIAVTSLQHTAAVTPKHPSGRRLAEIADVVIDNLAPYGDATIDLDATDSGAGVPVGAVSSITCAFIAQLLTAGVAQRISATGRVPPLYLSANIPGGDEHNSELERQYAGRLRRGG